MNKVVLSLIILFLSQSIKSQSSLQWRWFQGDSTINLLSIHGELGIASDTSYPGGRHGMAHWQDKEGNFWMFSGEGREMHHRDGNVAKWLRDLWKYSPVSNQWTYYGGATLFNSRRSFYGTKGIPSVNNWPGSRKHMSFWTDTAGIFWIYGGFGHNSFAFEYLNELWNFNPQSLEWTFVDGDTIGLHRAKYGIKGVPDPTNHPGNRSEAATWVDNENNFWLFGGFQYNSTGAYGPKNDFWKYSLSNNVWTWMGGDTTLRALGKYGNKGILATDNAPPARESATYWKDVHGNFWLFGGAMSHPQNSGLFNDLWKYDIQTHQWVWMNGDSTFNGYASPNWTQNFPSTDYSPSARVAAQSWTFGDNYLWLFGGPYRNDLWKYNINTNEWTWVKGESFFWPVINYGQKGVFADSNQPGFRSGAATWVRNNDEVWMFGGYGSPSAGYMGGFLQDFWQLKNIGSLPLWLLNFSGQINGDIPVIIWTTAEEKDVSHFELSRSLNGREFSVVHTTPAKNSFLYNQYSFNDIEFTTLSATQVYYRLKMIDKDGKATFSNIVLLKTKQEFNVNVFPNPASEILTVQIRQTGREALRLQIADVSGRIVMQETGITHNHSFDIRHLNKGVYFLTITGQEKRTIQFIKQ